MCKTECLEAKRQEVLTVKIKKMHPDAAIPQYAHDGDAGLDLTAVEVEADDCGNIVYRTGLAFEIPKGYAMFLFPRSSNYKKELILSNSVGLVDSGFRGEVLFKFKDLHFGVTQEPFYKVGDRIGQAVIMPFPKITFEEVEDLTMTTRGVGGYGSTGA